MVLKKVWHLSGWRLESSCNITSRSPESSYRITINHPSRNFTPMAFEPVSSSSFSTPITFFKPLGLFEPYSHFEALTLAIPLQETLAPWYPTCLAWPSICVSTQTSPPPGSLLHVPPTPSPALGFRFYFLASTHHSLTLLVIQQQTPHEQSSKRQKESKLTQKEWARCHTCHQHTHPEGKFLVNKFKITRLNIDCLTSSRTAHSTKPSDVEYRRTSTKQNTNVFLLLFNALPSANLVHDDP